MTAQTKAANKLKFETGDVPTEADFADLIDSYQDVDAGLADIAGLTPTDSNIIVGDGANWVAESGATARTSLGAASTAQGALADSATQPGDDADTLGSGAAADGEVLTADGAGGAAWEAVAGGGTVTSVAVSGSDGLEVDSGSPVTGSGTIALGVHATNLRAHINVEDGADVTDAANVGPTIHGATAKTTPVDADTMPLIDSAAANVLKKVTWVNIVATLTTAFNSLYKATGADETANVTAATATAQGKVELATDAETVTGTDTARATTPANITARLAAPGAIGGTTPGAGNFTALTLTGAVDFNGQAVGGHVSEVATSVSGTLVLATHSGHVLVTSGNVTVPHASGSKGFEALIIAGGAHTVTFNSTTSAAMAAGDMMSVLVQDDASGTPTIRASLIAAADQVSFS